MVAIVNRRPMTLGIIPLLDAYINHQKEVITKRSEYDLATYKARLNIVDGFLKMMSILDKVIKVIRASKNKSDAKDNFSLSSSVLFLLTLLKKSSLIPGGFVCSIFNFLF